MLKLKKAKNREPDFFVVIRNSKDLKVYVKRCIRRKDQRPMFMKAVKDNLAKNDVSMPFDIAVGEGNLLYIRDHEDKAIKNSAGSDKGSDK